jgi:hypothetical protein
VIDVEFVRKDHDSILVTAIGRELEPLDPIIDPRTRLGGQMNWILMVKKKIKILNLEMD